MATGFPYRDDGDLLERMPCLEPSGAVKHDQHSHSRNFQFYTLSVLLSLVFLVDLAGNLSAAPMMRIEESIICHDFYTMEDPSLIHGGIVDEQYCKIDPVQEELAFLNGWQSFFELLPGLFLAIPYGILADTYGRKWFMVLNTVSLFLQTLWLYIVFAFPQTLPIRLMWLSGAFTILGGGPQVVTTLFLVVMTDVTPETRRATVFFYGQSIVLVTVLLGPPLGSFLMDKSPWLPMNLGLALTALGVPLVLALPETLIVSTARVSTMDNHNQTIRTEPLYSDSNSSKYSLGPTKSTSHPCGIEAPLTMSLSSDASSSSDDFFSIAKPSLSSHITSHISSILIASHFILHDWRIPFLIVTGATQTVADMNGSLLLQYIPKRYAWTISQANYLSSLRAVTSIIALLVFLPIASKWCLRHKAHTNFSKDVLLCRISLALGTAGMLIDGLAPTIALFLMGLLVQTLGAGTAALIRSLLAGLVQPTKVARLFVVVGLVQTVSMLVAAPLLAALFQQGLRSGGGWVGLPYIAGAILVGVMTTGMWVLRLGSEGAKTGKTDEV